MYANVLTSSACKVYVMVLVGCMRPIVIILILLSIAFFLETGAAILNRLVKADSIELNMLRIKFHLVLYGGHVANVRLNRNYFDVLTRLVYFTIKS